jgi:hypothetical protein
MMEQGSVALKHAPLPFENTARLPVTFLELINLVVSISRARHACQPEEDSNSFPVHGKCELDTMASTEKARSRCLCPPRCSVNRINWKAIGKERLLVDGNLSNLD